MRIMHMLNVLIMSYLCSNATLFQIYNKTSMCVYTRSRPEVFATGARGTKLRPLLYLYTCLCSRAGF